MSLTSAVHTVTPEVLARQAAAFGNCASWAVWQEDGPVRKKQWAEGAVALDRPECFDDPQRYDPDRTPLRRDIIILGLNFAVRMGQPDPEGDWSAFHEIEYRNEKLRCAVSGTAAEGAYMTDLVKAPTDNADGRWSAPLRLTDSAKVLMAHTQPEVERLRSEHQSDPSVLVADVAEALGLLASEIGLLWQDGPRPDRVTLVCLGGRVMQAMTRHHAAFAQTMGLAPEAVVLVRAPHYSAAVGADDYRRRFGAAVGMLQQEGKR